MVAYKYRMGAGFAGDVNRTHPASIEADLVDSTDYPTAFGQPVILDSSSGGIRHFTADDTDVTKIHGITVRPYPFQQSSATNYGETSIGSATPPTSGVLDVMTMGYIMGAVNGTPEKGGTVYVWCAESTGDHVQGGFEAEATSGSTATLSDNYMFNGAPDSDGVTEVVIKI